MKTLVIILVFPFYGLAQTVDLEPRIKALEANTSKVESEYKQEVQNLRKEIAEYKLAVDNNSIEVTKITKQKVESDDDRLKAKSALLINSSEFIKAANKSFKSIDVSLVQVSFLQEITKLNNPTNSDLGFSLKEVIDQLIQKHIISNDKAVNKGDRLSKFINGILNNPITEIAKSAIPTINTVVSFISNISFGSKKIKEEDFDKFVKELQAYINHYEGLGNSTKEFQLSLEQIKIRTKALEMILHNYTTDRVSELFGSDFTATDSPDLDQLYKSFFTREAISNQITKIRTSNGSNLVETLKDSRLNFSMTTITQARFIQDELEALTNQYVNAHTTYLQSIIDVLNKSKSLEKADKDKIDQKIASLKASLGIWSTKFRSLVDVDDVKKQVKSVSNHTIVI
jgi:hypothetical protein